jgi:hypothetical protein
MMLAVLVGCGGEVGATTAPDAGADVRAAVDVGAAETGADASVDSATDACGCVLYGAELGYLCGETYQGREATCAHCNARCTDPFGTCVVNGNTIPCGDGGFTVDGGNCAQSGCQTGEACSVDGGTGVCQ